MIQRAFTAAAVFMSILICPGQASATAEEATFLRRVAEQYMLAQFEEQPGVRIRVSSGRLDPNRDYGGRCEGYLTAEIPGGEIKQNTTVKLTCTHPQHPFTIYMPVAVKMYRPALTAAVNIPRGTVITEDMVSESWLADGVASPGGISDRSMLIGSKMKRDVKAGDQFRPNTFCLVCRGDPVIIDARKGALSLKTSGEAMSDGNYSDSIQVRNTKSRKIITAIVRGAGLVEVPF